MERVRKVLEVVPNGLHDINDYYGNPDVDDNGELDLGWPGEHLVAFPLPFPMRLSWRPEVSIHAAKMHYKIGNIVVDALAEIVSRVPLEYLQACECDFYGGVFNFRRNRRSNRLSTHSWGIAIDINPHLGPIGGPDNQPAFIKEAFTSRGFVTFHDDAMHFQACEGY